MGRAARAARISKLFPLPYFAKQQREIARLRFGCMQSKFLKLPGIQVEVWISENLKVLNWSVEKVLINIKIHGS